MSISDLKVLYGLFVLCASLVAASPTLAMVMPLPKGKPFSELWLLGDGQMAEGYPLAVVADREYSIAVGAGNHMGGSEYYTVYVKLRNQTQSPPDVINSQPSQLSPLYEFRFLLQDGETWESHPQFALYNITFQNNIMYVGGISINQVAFSLDLVSARDLEKDGFYCQLFFELWRYDTISNGLQFHNRFVGIWLNMTA